MSRDVIALLARSPGRRSLLEDVDTAALARRFTEALVERHGGVVWEPGSRLVREPHLLGGTDHPAVSAVTEKHAVLV